MRPATKAAADVERQTRKATAALVEHINAGDRLQKLEEDLKASDTAAESVDQHCRALVKTDTQLAVVLLSQHVEAITRL